MSAYQAGDIIAIAFVCSTCECDGLTLDLLGWGYREDSTMPHCLW